MVEQQSIRDELADFIEYIQTKWEADEYSDPLANFTAIALLASPVIRRIQAEAIRDASRDLYHEMRRGMVDPIKYLELGAVRIEKGDIA